MSLATRCTSCGTVFRVVQDQLRVSSGWVRCGRCSEVFNGIESLVDLELDRLGKGASGSAHGARVMDDLARVSGSVDSAPASPGADEPPPSSSPEFAFSKESSHFPSTDVPHDIFGHGTADLVFDLAGPRPPAPVPAAMSAPADFPAGPAAADPADEAPRRAPGFVRQADRAAQWRRPGVRAVLSLMVFAALSGLAWQVHLSHHDWLAARWPVLRPAVERLCGLSGCTIEPPRRIESLVVESSGLVRAGAAGTYRLSMVMRNRDRLALRTPAVDLSLTDSQGRVIARRVLQATELGVTDAAVEPGAELALSATLRTRDTPVVGYTIEIFYP